MNNIIDIMIINKIEAIQVNVNDFYNCFRTYHKYIDLITNYEILQTGLCAKCFNTEIYISKNVLNNCFRIGILVDNSYKWSENIPIHIPANNLDKMLKLKAFW